MSVVLAACTGSGSSVPSSTNGETREDRLVVIDDDGDVVVMRPDGSERRTLTSTADDEAVNGQAVWSPDGQHVAWSRLAPGPVASIVIADADDSSTVVVPTVSLSFYLSWSPDATSLAMLHNGATSIDFGLIEVDRGALEIVDHATPFYLAWEPGSSGGFATHAGPARLDVYDVDGSRARSIPTDPGYLAPAWTPDGILHVSGDRLVLNTADGGVRSLIATSGLVLFVPDPAGGRIAIQMAGGEPPITASRAEVQAAQPGSVFVLELATNELTHVLDGQVVGMFWSPDGESLLLYAPGEEAAEIQPIVWMDGETTSYTAFRPSLSLARDLLPFYPQYAQSMRLWAPDSTRFVFPGTVDDEEGVWVQRVSGGDPVLVSDGTWVDWSP